jgi:hypothetical protein
MRCRAHSTHPLPRRFSLSASCSPILSRQPSTPPDVCGFYVRAKGWKNTSSRPEIRVFVGAPCGQDARKGVFVTSLEFSMAH